MTPHPSLLAVQTALTAVNNALDPEERRLAIRDLIDAGVALLAQSEKRHQWLLRNWDRLTELERELPEEEFKAKEDIWLARDDEYKQMINTLAEVLIVVDLPTLDEVEAKQGSLL